MFIEEDLLVLRGDQLIHYDRNLQEVGSLKLDTKPVSIGYAADELYTFHEEAGSVRVEEVDLVWFGIKRTAGIIDVPDFEPELVEFDEDSGTVYLIDQETRELFLWSAQTDSYLARHRLDEGPTWATLSAAHQRLYLGYASGSITYFDLHANKLEEQQFAHLPSAVLGLKAAGPFIFAADRSDAWNRYYSFSERGRLIDTTDWQDVGQQYVWNPVTERIYHLGSYSDELKWIELSQTSGRFGASSRTFAYSDRPALPLRLDPTGQALIAGDGRIYDLSSSEFTASVDTLIADAVWLSGTLYTLSGDEMSSSIQGLTIDYLPASRYALTGRATRLFGYSGKLLVLVHSGRGTSLVSVKRESADKPAIESARALYSASGFLVI